VFGEGSKRAEIGTQISLSGGLFETLQAQSSGIGTVSTIFRNPVDAIAVMKPDPDLQTGAVITPDGPEFTNVHTNFVQTATLDSPEQAGLPTSVEASQFSRALTLAEMAAKDKFLGGKECGCLLGRPDLSFINVGYQLKVLRGASADNTDQTFGATTGNFKEGQRLRLAAEEKLAADLAVVQQQFSETSKAIQAEIAAATDEATILALQNELSAAQQAAGAQLGEIEDQSNAALAAALSDAGIDEGPLNEQAQALEDGKPIAGSSQALSQEEVATRVNTFLTNLYTNLDDGHQELEAALRGDTITLRNPDVPAEVVRFGAGGVADDNFAAPFGALGRGFGGDPAALAAQGATALDDLGNALDDFGANMRAQVRRAELLVEIQGIELQIAALKNVKEASLSDETDEAKAAQEEIDALLIELANKQHELDVLNQEFPP